MHQPAKSELMPPLALLAGGLATRLRPLTETIPKSLINIADEPFIGHQLRLLAREGITEIVICTGHLGERINAYVGDGSRWGCHVRYSADGDMPLGTGGALRRALPLLGERFFVMYGDSYLNIHFRSIYEAFCRSGLPALMTVFRNEGRWDDSNVEFAAGVIRSYDKAERTSAMRYIDYGLGGFEAHVVRACPANTPFDLADLYRDLVRRRLLAGCEVHQRFYEIGSPAGLAETDAFLRRVSAARGDG